MGSMSIRVIVRTEVRFVEMIVYIHVGTNINTKKLFKNDLSNLPLMPKFHVDNIEAESFYILLDH